MAEPSLQQIFGTGATQTAAVLTVSKADLAAKGLTASNSNSSESLLVALILLAKDRLTNENQAANPEQSITISDGFISLVNRNNQTFRQTTLTINLQKADTVASAIDPNDY